MAESKGDWNPGGSNGIDVSGYSAQAKNLDDTESSGRVRPGVRAATSVIVTTPNGDTHAIDYGWFCGPPIVSRDGTKLVILFHGFECEGDDIFNEKLFSDGVWMVKVGGKRLHFVHGPVAEQRKFEIKVTGDKVPDDKAVVDGIAIVKLSK